MPRSSRPRALSCATSPAISACIVASVSSIAPGTPRAAPAAAPRSAADRRTARSPGCPRARGSPGRPRRSSPSSITSSCSSVAEWISSTAAASGTARSAAPRTARLTSSSGHRPHALAARQHQVRRGLLQRRRPGWRAPRARSTRGRSSASNALISLMYSPALCADEWLFATCCKVLNGAAGIMRSPLGAALASEPSNRSKSRETMRARP